MEIYQDMLEEMGFDCSDWQLPPRAPTPESSSESENEETPFVLSFQDEVNHRRNVKKKIPYNRLTHFKEHLQRLQARELVHFPDWLLTWAASLEIDWLDVDIYYKVRRRMKRDRIHRKFYEHIFSLVKRMGGHVINLPEDYITTWVKDFPVWDWRWKQLYPRNNFPSYFILLQILIRQTRIELPYSLPTVSKRKYQPLYSKLVQVLYGYDF